MPRASTCARASALTGTRDPRFPLEWVTQLAQNLRDDGAHVALEPLDADHFLLLTHADAWTARAAGWISERSAVASPAGP